ncbi:MAG TPA: LuxR C-terminal-related transcriptional regulator [Spirochaetota bacterium]|nr:LuxR C-terminal-related transcriptional regulator [Spirochaetota bacterium]HPC43472.1 LuxR C-terminal-related transcriptional regulator [Spirochaetota bacterium]HQF06930.1 LuxR C-terminal-related transcriptional regulator [Spirochaetota bacterium]HQH95451.1 LuxR C-terminal-related transcriptional regulator [Spirochaetota bacterium]HQJ72609.1 LuxR C-terminal-related transcriptional regulator [Spirochaetota bacterium]
MNIFLYNLEFLGIIICLFLGFYAIVRDRRSIQRRLFFIICILLALANLTAILGYTAPSRECIFFWSQSGSCLVNSFYAVNLHFYLNLLRKKPPPWVIPLLYVPALVIIVAFALDPLSVLDYTFLAGEWKMIPNYGSRWFYAAAGYVVLYTLFAVVAIAAFGIGAESNKEKLQAKLLMANLILSTLIGIFGLWVIPFFDYRIPNIGAAYHLAYAVGLFFSVFYLKFLDLKPSIVAEEIIANIGDMVVLLGPDLKVLSANAAFQETLGYSRGGLEGRHVRDIIDEQDDIAADIDLLKKGPARKLQRPLRYRINRKKEREYISTDSYVSKVTDRFADVIGFLMISRVNAGRKQFQVIHRITDRELEIVDLTLEGLSSTDIGARLGISARTVQSHQEHVYQKLGVTGKVELVRVAHRFNL